MIKTFVLIDIWLETKRQRYKAVYIATTITFSQMQTCFSFWEVLFASYGRVCIVLHTVYNNHSKIVHNNSFFFTIAYTCCILDSKPQFKKIDFIIHLSKSHLPDYFLIQNKQQKIATSAKIIPGIKFPSLFVV